MDNLIVAIDGPAGSGKSTIAKLIAKKFNFTYIDTGAMYRMITLYLLEDNLVNLQRKISNNKNVILDGRDIGTVVFPNAKVKIFLVATAEERARRRYNEFLEKKVEITYDEVLKSLKERDYIDSTRKESPLKKADDAIELDTTNLTIEDVINFISKEIEKNIN